jgi:hypothetical protein
MVDAAVENYARSKSRLATTGLAGNRDLWLAHELMLAFERLGRHLRDAP